MDQRVPPSPKVNSIEVWIRRWTQPPREQRPVHREIRLGLMVLAAFVAVFVVFAAFVRLDAAVSAAGVVTISGNRQAVQHRDGGIVRTLPVHEGDRVAKGQILLTLVPDELQANVRAMSNQVIGLDALEARLLAELNGTHTIVFPARFGQLTGDDKAAADTAVRLQQLEFNSRASALATDQDVLRQQINQSNEQIIGYRGQLEANREQQRLIAQEIESLSPLVDKGLTPMTRIRSLQRNAADLKGTEGQYAATIAATQQQIGERRLRIEDISRQRDADDSKDYRTAEQQLAELRPKLIATQQQLDRTVVRAPASGRVVGLSVFTVGGVVAAGQKLADVVPDDQPLVIEAKVPPQQADDLRIGQATEIRVSAFHDRRMPLLKGVVSKVSADSLTDEKTGTSFFRIEVTVPPEALATIRNVRGADAGLRPGLPVEVVIPLRARTALSYLVSPLRDMIWRSFREH